MVVGEQNLELGTWRRGEERKGEERRGEERRGEERRGGGKWSLQPWKQMGLHCP